MIEKNLRPGREILLGTIGLYNSILYHNEKFRFFGVFSWTTGAIWPVQAF